MLKTNHVKDAITNIYGTILAQSGFQGIKVMAHIFQLTAWDT